MRELTDLFLIGAAAGAAGGLVRFLRLRKRQRLSSELLRQALGGLLVGSAVAAATSPLLNSIGAPLAAFAAGLCWEEAADRLKAWIIRVLGKEFGEGS